VMNIGYDDDELNKGCCRKLTRMAIALVEGRRVLGLASQFHCDPVIHSIAWKTWCYN
jgi:hypothetical protein